MSKSSQKPTKEKLAVSETVKAPVLNQNDQSAVHPTQKRSFVDMHKNIERVPPLIIPGYVTYG